MTKETTKSRMISFSVLAILLPLASGCAVTARGVFAPPTVSVRATLPMPPTVVVTAPAPSAIVVASAQPTPVAVAPVDDGIELGAPQDVYAVSVSVAPPPPPSIVVTTPAPRRGYVWVAGHYTWSGHRWVWSQARWVRERAGQVWVGPRYESSRRIWIRGHFEPLRSSVTTVRPMPEPATEPEPAVSSTPSASGSVGFHIGFNAEAHASTH